MARFVISAPRVLWIRIMDSLWTLVTPALFFFLRKSRVAKPVDTYKIASIFDARLFYNVVRTHTHTHVRPFSTLYARVMIERYVDSVWTVLLILRVHNTPSSPRRWNIKSAPLPRFVNIGEEKKLYTRMGENNLSDQKIIHAYIYLKNRVYYY